jgi:flavin-dependent dehydrogenase
MRLASAGLDVAVFDEKLAWEKPCGGGLTYKAYQRYPFLLENDRPKRFVHETFIAAPGVGVSKMALREPMLIYSRFDLNNLLLERAEKAGARIEKARVTEMTRSGSGWRLRTSAGMLEADFCVVATGARNSFREVGTQWTAADTMHAMGYYVPAEQAHIDIQFLPQLEGYIWVFPRCGHLSVGICGKREPAQKLRTRLESYMQEHGMASKGACFYSHMLPSLDSPGWTNNRVAGPGWMAVGDAAGLVDPVTGEGIYYAMRSGDLAGEVLLAEDSSPAEKHHVYRALLARDFTADLEFGARLARCLFLGRFLWGSVPARMVQIIRRSPKFHELMQDLVAGTQSYAGLKSRLFRNMNGTFLDIVLNFLLTKFVPGESRV